MTIRSWKQEIKNKASVTSSSQLFKWAHRPVKMSLLTNSIKINSKKKKIPKKKNNIEIRCKTNKIRTCSRLPLSTINSHYAHGRHFSTPQT